MFQDTIHSASSDASTVPQINHITLGDLRDALARGIDDFRTKPSHLLFLGLIYPLAMLVLARMVLAEGLLALLFPVVSGGALLGPFVAIGLYEISRRRERGYDVHLRDAFECFRSPARGSIFLLGVALAAIFVLWLASALAIYRATMGGMGSASALDFIRQIVTTEGGWALIVIGNGVGFVFAALVLTLTVVSFPLLLDRHVGLATAVATSIRAVAANPLAMTVWGLMVVALLVLGALPFFAGLAVVVPVLGHATWHLYRKVVD